jgi:replication factor A1
MPITAGWVQAYKSGHHPVVAVKGGRLGEFQGRNLSTIGSTQVNVDPQIDAAMRLRQW